MGAAAVAPKASLAQATAPVRRLAILVPYPSNDAETRGHINAFLGVMASLGWVAERDFHLEIRWAESANAVAEAARELAVLAPDVILVRSTLATAALLRETRTIPIVFVVVSDPIGDGFVASMARPEGNATGFTNVEASVVGKWLEILIAFDSRVRRLCLLYGPQAAAGGGGYYLGLLRDAAAQQMLQIIPAPVASAADVDRAVESFAEAPEGGIVVLPDAVTIRHRRAILSAAERTRLPAVYPFREFVADGGLASYGIDIADLYRRAALYTDRLLRGGQVGELPVQGPIRFTLAVNVQTARSLGLDTPTLLLASADEVIE